MGRAQKASTNSDQHANSTAVLYSCDIYSEPGEKNGDHCFWSAPSSALENAVDAWHRVVDRALLTNACRHATKTDSGAKLPAACGAMRSLGGYTRPVRYPEHIFKLGAVEMGIQLRNVRHVLSQKGIERAEREASEWARLG